MECLTGSYEDFWFSLDNFEQISDFHFKSHTGCGVEKDSMHSRREVGQSVSCNNPDKR